MKIRLTVAVAAVLALAACSNPMDAVIPTTGPEQTKFAQDVMSKLSEKDRAFLAAYMMRRVLAESFDKSAALPPGTTVRQAIAEQTAWMTKQAAAKAEEDSRTKERQDAREAAAQQLAKTVKITYAGKDIEPANEQKRRYSDMQLIYLDVENIGSKPISGLQGSMRFIDMFGNVVSEIPLQITDTIDVGKKLEWTGAREIKQFNETDKAVRNLQPGKYSTGLTLQTIVFTDGTKLESP